MCSATYSITGARAGLLQELEMCSITGADDANTASVTRYAPPQEQEPAQSGSRARDSRLALGWHCRETIPGAFRLAVARRLIGVDSVARASLSQDASSVMNSTIGAQVLHHCRSWCDERHHWRPAATTAGAGTLRTTTARVPRSRQELELHV